MQRLPNWVLTNPRPAMYDFDSGTAIEQTARVYAAMNELIDSYNAFVDSMNNANEVFQNEVKEESNLFAVALRQEFQDFIDIVDLKMSEAENFMKNNLQQSADKYLNEIIEDLHNDMDTFEQDRARFEEGFETQNAAIKTQNDVLAGAISTMNERLNTQDTRINEAVSYMQTNLEMNVNAAIEQLIDNGTITMGLGYEEETEALSFAARNIGIPTDLAVGYDPETESITLREVPIE